MRTRRGQKLSNALVYLVLVLAAVGFLAPLAWMISTSLKPLNETMTLPQRWIPSVIQWHNYPDAIHAMRYFWRYAGNSLFLCCLTVIGTLISSALAAYGFSRIQWKGRDGVFLLLLATMMIPFPVVMVPIYTLFKSVGWIGSFKPLWVPVVFCQRLQCFSSPAVFSEPPHRHIRGRPHRWMQRVSDFLPDHPAVVQTGPAGGRHLSIHGHLERFPRTIDFPDRSEGFYSGVRVAKLSKPAWRHRLASIDGRLHPGRASGDGLVLLRPTIFHPRHRLNRKQKLTREIVEDRARATPGAPRARGNSPLRKNEPSPAVIIPNARASGSRDWHIPPGAGHSDKPAPRDRRGCRSHSVSPRTGSAKLRPDAPFSARPNRW